MFESDRQGTHKKATISFSPIRSQSEADRDSEKKEEGREIIGAKELKRFHQQPLADDIVEGIEAS